MTAPAATPQGWLWGPFSRLGLAVGLATVAIDQAHKWWMLLGARVAERGRYAVLEFLDIRYVLNTGVSFSFLDGRSYKWQITLAIFAVLAAAAMMVWLARAGSGRLMAWSLGLIAGGAVANAIDRVVHGGVVDYLLPHAFGLDWPAVFNIADVAIVAGVIGLLYESFVTSRNDAANPL